MPKDEPLDYQLEPCRDDLQLIVRKDMPFNAEPELPNLVKHYLTPTKYFFCRSHGPLPQLNDDHKITIKGIGLDSEFVVSVKQLKSDFKEKTIEMAMQCAGNRRDGLHKVKFTKGVIWGPGAIGNASYTGCLLKDVLASIGIDRKLENISSLHLAFQSVEQCEEDRCYGSSIPLSKALDECGDVLLAYKMNGEPLTRDHGAPIRVVVPGYIGARSVKFLKSMTIQDFESESYFQRKDYKVLPDEVETEQQAAEYWCKVASIGEYNVQSYVCDPPDGLVKNYGGPIKVRGYALSGGGRGIQRVQVSGDDGVTWTLAHFRKQPKYDAHTTNVWAWSLWEADIHVKRNTRIVCRALDSANNMQHENPMWNYRGVMNNSWRTFDSEKRENSNL
ncbi:unnamed protein product [Absidia cylindrospora]